MEMRPPAGGMFIVAGAAGTLGKSFVRKAVEVDVPVVAFDTRELTPMDPAVTFYHGSLAMAEPKITELLLKRPSPHICFYNFTGISSAQACEDNPGEAFMINTKLALDLAAFASRIKCERYVFLSTGYVYGDRSLQPHSENDPVYVSNSYVNSKLAAEHLLSLAAQGNVLRVTVARLSNIYSSQSSPETVFGRLMEQFSKNRPLQVVDTAPVRDFLFIDDAIDALMRLALLDMGKEYDVFNISSGIGTSIGDIVKMISNLTGQSSLMPAGDMRHASTIVLDNRKAMNELEWRPLISLSRGIELLLKDITYESKA